VAPPASRIGRWLICALALALAGWARAEFSSPVQEAVHAAIGRGALPQLRQPAFAGHRNALTDFYAPRAYLPAWFADGQPQPDIAIALDHLRSAPAHGLVAADYDIDWLAGEIDAIATSDGSAQRVARADVALTLTLLRYLSDMHVGRVMPQEAGFRMRSKDARFDPAAALAGALAAHDLDGTVASAEPSFAIYGRLKTLLARYRELATRQLPPLPPLPPGKRRIEPGDSYPGAAALASRLALLDDLPAAAATPPPDRYEGALVDAVRSFQGRNGLEQDGVLGKDTLAQLNVPIAHRVRQLELAMERLRWLPRFGPGPVIAVNIPSYTLWALDQPAAPGAPMVTMRVIVGRAAKARQTPIFIGDMRHVEFSPYWNVPPSIQKNELVPKLMHDPGYLGREDMEIVGSSRGPPITGVDAAALVGLRDGSLRIRQRPGPKNALGGIKFVLPNTMNIYLHGTPARELFGRARRDFSHGCIRVADPFALAQFVLRDRPEWTRERMREAIEVQIPHSVQLRSPVPVVIFYTTAIVTPQGRAEFSPDVYGYDRKLGDALARREATAKAAGAALARP